MSQIRKAGLSEGYLNLAYFSDSEELRTILNDIGIIESVDGHLVTGEGGRIRCSCCSKDMTVDEVGHILPGSTYLYCRDPVCILDYYERFF